VVLGGLVFVVYKERYRRRHGTDGPRLPTSYKQTLGDPYSRRTDADTVCSSRAWHLKHHFTVHMRKPAVPSACAQDGPSSRKRSIQYGTVGVC
jgi:hypothetical protein